MVHTNHATTKYLMNKPNGNARRIGWLLLSQQFDLTIVDKPRKENMVAYFLSRLNLPTRKEEMAVYQILDGHIFSTSVLCPWSPDIENYLVAGRFPPNLSSREKRIIVKKSTTFTWIGGNLFTLGLGNILRRCVVEEEVFKILSECHDGPCGVHFATKRTTFKFIQ